MKAIGQIIVFLLTVASYAQEDEVEVNLIDIPLVSTEETGDEELSEEDEKKKFEEFKENYELYNAQFEVEQGEDVYTEQDAFFFFNLLNTNLFVPEAIIIDDTELELVQKDPLEQLDYDDEPRLRGPSQFDSRIEIHQLNPESDWQIDVLRNSASIGMVIDKNLLRSVTDSIYYLDISNTLGNTINVCESEPFINQPIVGSGTAFLIGDSVMITANHVFQNTIDQYAVIFDFEMVTAGGVVNNLVKANQVYYPSEIVKREVDYDIALFRLGRKPLRRKTIARQRSISIPTKSEIYMVGHPMGQPKKVALNASITENNHPDFFYSTLDGFRGNSGSPVFNMATHRVIGILVSGEQDYEFNGTCWESTICQYPYCKGEKIIRIERVMNGVGVEQIND